MKKDRNLFYSNYNAGAQIQPNPMAFQPSGFMANTNYSSYGPNAMPMQNMMPNQMQAQNMGYSANTVPMQQEYTQGENFETRITRCERQIKRLDTRVSKLEANTDIVDDIDGLSSPSCPYMI